MSDKKYPFGVVIRERRLQLGLTQDALAERANICSRWVQRLESGRQQPTVISFFNLAHGLDCEVGVLIREFQAAWREQGAPETQSES